MKKILVSDYDGTLFLNDDDIRINIQMIDEFRKKGNFFVIATGRSYESIKKQIKKYNISFDYLILGHGTVILDRKEKPINFYAIDNLVAKNIINSISSFKNNISKIRLYGILKEDININDESVTKIRILTKTIEASKNISEYINSNFNEYVKSYVIDATEYIFTEIISINTDKGKAIEEILKYKNVSKENVYVIGDGSNDIEMIEKYNGYGMINSDQCVINVSIKIYNSVSDLIKEII